MDMRTCTKCGETKPLEAGYYRNSKGKGGFSAHCRSCWYRRPRVKPKAPEGFKKCTGCGEVKAATPEFWHLAKRGKYGLAAKCKPCQNALISRCESSSPEGRKVYYEQNKAWIISSQAARRTRLLAENPKPIRDTAAKWRSANRDKIRSEHRKWSERNRQSVRKNKRVSESKRRAMKMATEGPHYTVADIDKQFSSQNGRCWWCGSKLLKYHVDHRIPLSRGGSNSPDNIVISCPPCNLSKHDKMPWEFTGKLL